MLRARVCGHAWCVPVLDALAAIGCGLGAAGRSSAAKLQPAALFLSSPHHFYTCTHPHVRRHSSYQLLTRPHYPLQLSNMSAEEVSTRPAGPLSRLSSLPPA